MGPSESPTGSCQRQAVGRRRRRARRPRSRRCLLKGCGRRFHPRQARQRYCGERCRERARRWSRWKAQQRYRETAAGQEKRNGQSRRYRERVKSRKPAQPEAVREAARVITQEHFFRAHLQPAGVLRTIRTATAKSLAALLLRNVPASAGAGARAGAALETGAHLIRTYCRSARTRRTVNLSCNWSFTSSTGAGSIYACGIRPGSGGCWPHWRNAASKCPSWWWRPKARRTGMWSSTATSGSRRWNNWAGTQWKP